MYDMKQGKVKNNIKEPIEDKIYVVFVYIVLSIFTLSCLIPILHQIAISFSGPEAIYSGKVFVLPVDFSIDAYKMLLYKTDILNAFKNSTIITVNGTILRMFFTILAAYPLSKSYMYGRRFFSILILSTMMFSAGLIPNYLLIKSLGLINSYSAIWIPGLIGVFNLMVMRTYFEGISKDLEDSARIDGCTEWSIVWHIFLPLSKPVLAAMTLFYMVGLWNSFRNVLIYITDTNKYNLAVMVQQMIRSSSMTMDELINASESGEELEVVPEALKAAGIFVLLLPMMLIYPWLQKYFVKGVMIGAIKG